MKELLFKLKRFIRTVSIGLISSVCIVGLSLFGLPALAVDNTDEIIVFDNTYCMADAWVNVTGSILPVRSVIFVAC